MAKTEVPAYERMRRISLAVSPRLDQVLRTLGLEPEAKPDDGVPADGATQVTSALSRYADSIERASRELDRVLVRAEWNYLADVMNGCADLWDWSESPIPSLSLIRANAEDAHRLDRTGDKWFGEELDTGSGDKAAKAFFAKLAKLEPIHGDTILASVRWFWRHHIAIDHSEDFWWTIEFRTRKITEPV
jgi:hypothetical protein